MQREFVSVHVGVMMVADAPTTLDEATATLIVDRLTRAGHVVTPIEVVRDDLELVRSQIERWMRDAEMDVVIALAGFDADTVRTALAPLISRPLAGFSELFRVLTYNEIGTGAMLTDVIAAQCGATFVFVLPASKGAVGTALDKILIPQLDLRTAPRNLVMRMPRHKGAAFETSGPKAFPKEDTAPSAAPPPPARAVARSPTMPPPLPRKRDPSVHNTPPMPLAVVVPRASDPAIAVLDPDAVIEESVEPINRSMAEALERSIESSIEGDDGKTLPEAVLDPDHPSAIAAREHAEKSPEAQAAAWVAAVEQAADKVVKRAAAEREAREAQKPLSEPAINIDDLDAASVIEERSSANGNNDEPRGKIEKASGKPPSKPDHAVDKEDAVIVEDPDLIAAEKRLRAPSMRPKSQQIELLPPPLPLRSADPDLPVFGARGDYSNHAAQPQRNNRNRGWVVIGGLAVIAAAVLIVLALGRRDGTTSAATDPNPPPSVNPPPSEPLTNTNPPPVNPTEHPAGGSAIEMDPARVNDPKPPQTVKDPKDLKDPKDPKNDPKDLANKPPTPREPRQPKQPVTDPDPDLTKAPTNPTTGDCDEVTCILNKFDKPCCARFKPAEVEVPKQPKQPENAGPIELDKTLIRIGVERFRPQVIACGETATAKGTVKLDVKVRPDGSVDSVAVAESPDPALGVCAAAVMRKATFAKTQNGGSFSYPFVF